jgi:hypothetical protein
MHAVITKLRIHDPEAAAKVAREERAPNTKQQPGFVAAYWINFADGDEGISIRIFESEEAARQAKEEAAASTSDVATVESREVGEVIASA